MSSKSICSVPGCDKPVSYRKLCKKHVTRWERHGDPLVVKKRSSPAIDFLQKAYAYEGDECLFWPYSAVNGYGRVGRELASRKVCEHQNGPPPTLEHEAAHECGNGHLGCVNKRHLSWKTHKENCADMKRHGTLTRGEQRSTAKITEADALAIRAIRGKSQREIGRQFGISHTVVSHIQHGTRWAHVKGD